MKTYVCHFPARSRSKPRRYCEWYPALKFGEHLYRPDMKVWIEHVVKYWNIFLGALLQFKASILSDCSVCIIKLELFFVIKRDFIWKTQGYLLEPNRNASRPRGREKSTLGTNEVPPLYHLSLTCFSQASDQLLFFSGWCETDCVCSLAPQHDMCSSSTQKDWTFHQIPERRTNGPDLDLLPHGSSQLWSKAGSHGANIAARSQPSFLVSPDPLSILALYRLAFSKLFQVLSCSSS